MSEPTAADRKRAQKLIVADVDECIDRIAAALAEARQQQAWQVRKAWELGFALAVSYGDNHFHFAGEEKERHWQRLLNALAAMSPPSLAPTENAHE